ncbi:hypothetical protein IWQ60_010862, partial [Tieghemiomyces parasiticus]
MAEAYPRAKVACSPVVSPTLSAESPGRCLVGMLPDPKVASVTLPGSPPAAITSDTEELAADVSNDNLPRRPRIQPELQAILEASFENNPLPDRDTKLMLAKKLGRPLRYVQIWFQNKRQTAKKHREKQERHRQWSAYYNALNRSARQSADPSSPPLPPPAKQMHDRAAYVCPPAVTATAPGRGFLLETLPSRPQAASPSLQCYPVERVPSHPGYMSQSINSCTTSTDSTGTLRRYLSQTPNATAPHPYYHASSSVRHSLTSPHAASLHPTKASTCSDGFPPPTLMSPGSLEHKYSRASSIETLRCEVEAADAAVERATATAVAARARFEAYLRRVSPKRYTETTQAHSPARQQGIVSTDPSANPRQYAHSTDHLPGPIRRSPAHLSRAHGLRATTSSPVDQHRPRIGYRSSSSNGGDTGQSVSMAPSAAA